MKTKTLALAAVVMLMSGLAWAQQQASDQFQVLATVINTCEISAPNDLNFGNYNPLDPNHVDQTVTFQVRCTRNTPNVWVGLNDGVNGTRFMASGTNLLDYELYQDTGRTTVWGNTQTDGVPYNPTNSGWYTMTVYGRLFALQDVPAGSYADTVTATINW